jgi:long-chain acyl-CoA synthetase
VTGDAPPWLAQYDDAMRAVVGQERTIVALLDAGVAAGAERVALAYRDARDLRRARSVDRRYRRRSGRVGPGTPRAGCRGAAVGAGVRLRRLGAWKAGGVVVPINPMYREEQLVDLFTDSAAHVLVCALEHGTSSSGRPSITHRCSRSGLPKT